MAETDIKSINKRAIHDTKAREDIEKLSSQYKDIENQIKYISPTTFDEFVEMTSELGLFYVLSRNINITWENQTYNVIGLYDVRSHSNGLNYYGFQKMHQFVVNSTTKEITSFSSFRVYIENQIANDVELDENNLLYLVRDGAKIGTGITLPSTSGSGSDGRGITKIEKTATVGLIDTYTITYTDNTTSTFEVKNGYDGEEGIGIQSVEKTSTDGLVDTYTITRTDGTIAGTFTVTKFTVTNWKLIKHDTLPADTQSILLTEDSEGNSFSCNEFCIFFKVPKLDAKTTFRFFTTDTQLVLLQDNSFGDTREKYIKYNIKFECDTIQGFKYSANANSNVMNVVFANDLVSNVAIPYDLPGKNEQIKITFGVAIENLEFWIYGR